MALFNARLGLSVGPSTGIINIIDVAGNATVTALTTTGNLTVGSSKLTVDATTGNTVVAGTLSVSGDITASSTGALQVPSGTTAQRPANVAGKLRYNSDTGSFEGYTTAWGSIGGGATGAGGNAIFYLNGQTVTTTYSIPASQNASTTGPITINSGATVTVPSGQRWVVL